jgi:hypothetical protein
MNPPYGAEMGRWLAKLADHGNGISLIFARTETAMFHESVWDKAHGLLFLRGRLAFCDRKGKPVGSAGAPSVLVAYGKGNADVLASCELPGRFIRLEPSPAARPDLFTEAA